MGPSDPLQEEIEALLARPAGSDEVARLERTLTDGYARVLSLEAERSRLEKQIDRLAAKVDRSDASSRRELSTLARRAQKHADELRRLRALLASLRARYSAAVAAV